MGTPLLYDRARDVLRQELHHVKNGGHLDETRHMYIHSLLALAEGMQRYGPYSATPILLDEPRIQIDRERDGYLLHGCLHVLPDIAFGEVPLEFPLSYHHHRWTARHAARRWERRARSIAARLAVEVGGR